ncbi:MAG: ATP-binding protein [Cytophagales bacterium]
MFKSTVTKHYSTFCSLQNLRNIRNFVEESLSKTSLNTKDAQLIVLAVDEICSNSIIHSNNQNPNSLIDILLKMNKGEVVVEIKDNGKYFNYSTYKEPTVLQLIKNKAKGSMGLMIVRNVMDKVEYRHQKDTNILRLSKKI